MNNPVTDTACHMADADTTEAAAADRGPAGPMAATMHADMHTGMSADMPADMHEGHSGHHHRRGLAVLLPTMPLQHHENQPSRPRIVFVGNPNVGKSTLFNSLLGASATVMNAPGTTVLIETGQLEYEGQSWDVVDTPGTASLDALSPDEQVASEAAMGRAGNPEPQAIVAVFDVTTPSQSLYLLSQLMDLSRPLVVAVTMLDLAERDGSTITLERLRQAMPGLVVVRVDGRTGAGAASLKQAIAAAIAAPAASDWDDAQHAPADSPAVSVSVPGPGSDQEAVSQWVRRSADSRFSWVAQMVVRISGPDAAAAQNTLTRSDRLDGVLLHPVAGIGIFLIVMYLVFEATTSLAGPLIDWFDVTFRQWSTTAIDWLFTAVGGPLALDGWFHSLLVDGVLDGAVTVLTFIPPIGIMFVILSVLEDSGYLARAAFVMDRAMRMIGLDGRAFLPLVVGFGCNLPALASTRTLPDSRQRLMTGLLIPFTSCSARLSVYVVLAYAFFGQYAGLAIFLMYVASILIILAVGWALRKTQFADLRTQPFAMGLPPYQMPKLLQLGASVLQRLGAFMRGASSIIITMIILMWLLAAIPVSAGAAGTNSFAHVDTVEHSLYGAISSHVAPIFEPAGFNDWHASAALITGFVAKEVVVGSLSQSYAIHDAHTESGAQEGTGTLGHAVRQSFNESSHGHPQAAAAAFMIFVLAYTPCLATVAEMRRQYGGRTAVQSVCMGLAVAYVLAVVVFQIGRLL